jgi:hypothetical protein
MLRDVIYHYTLGSIFTWMDEALIPALVFILTGLQKAEDLLMVTVKQLFLGSKNIYRALFISDMRLGAIRGCRTESRFE